MPAAWQSLTRINEHERDKYVQFDEPTHIYTVKGETKGYISVTKFLHEFFPHFDADAVIRAMMRKPDWPQNKWYKYGTAEAIKAAWNANGAEASGAGTAMHLAIEQYLNGAEEIIDPAVKLTPEWRYFMNFWNTMGQDLEPYRTEWEVWSEEYRLTGSIDMIFRKKSTGRFVIYDWKRSKEIKIDDRNGTGLYPLDHLGNCNYWHYSLQLNVYRWFLQTYYGLEIDELYLIVLHPDNKNFRRIELNIMDDEVADMMEARLRAVKAGCHQKVILPMPPCDIEDD
jgi:ATP-dependent exoDNAse (exonuclease V) beta subunit